MNTKAIFDHLNHLEALIQEHNISQARDLAETILGGMMKAVYRLVRGQASAKVMRTLLELEIEIGGDNCDFNAFDNTQLINLFERGQIFKQLEEQIDGDPALSLAVECRTIGRWLRTINQTEESSILVCLQFIHAWLKLLGMETGLLACPSDVPASLLNDRHLKPQPVVPILKEGDRFYEPVSGMTFVYVPGGSYLMGDTFDEGVEDEKPVHEVTLSPFYIAIYPVTQAQWQRLMTENPSSFEGDDHPVEQVTLADVTEYLDRLNASTPENLRFDLPSEAQWEYAARSGGKAELYAGGQDPEAIAWFEANSLGGTAPVGQKRPNELGIHDMSGNVWEWCRDIYHPEAYRQHGSNDPVCTKGSSDRVIRGGSWHLDAWSVRCSRRFRFDPELFGPALGFRVVMEDRDQGFEDSRVRGAEGGENA